MHHHSNEEPFRAMAGGSPDRFRLKAIHLRMWCVFLIIQLVMAAGVCADGGEDDTPVTVSSVAADLRKGEEQKDTMSMLQSLVKLQADIEEQAKLTKIKIKESGSDTEKENLEKELARLDRQLAEAGNDFERIATDVDVALFAEKKPETFSWQEELAELVRPAIKELKRLTIRSRNKTRLRDTVNEFNTLAPVAHAAVQHLHDLISSAQDPHIAEKLALLLPEWENIEQRIQSKLELSELELARLTEQETNLSESLSNSTRNFFRERGIYLLGSVAAFILTLLLCRIASRFLVFLLRSGGKKQVPFHFRLLDLLFRGLAVVLAAFSCFLVLYLAEDWFLLSMGIIFFLGLAWTVRQGAAKMWQQARLMLNVGSMREGERVIVNGVPWRVERIHVFCTLYNPNLDLELRVPVEEMVGKVSRVCKPEDPWFPCKKGDWVVVGDKPRGRVVSLSHETVELVERGGKRTFYQTGDFLAATPVNLSRNFRLRVPFGITYSLQADATATIPEILQAYLEEKLEEKGYMESCLNLSVEFMRAGSSSLDLIVLADFKGEEAGICARIERYIQRCCVDACTANDWEIPFPQLTLHGPGGEPVPEAI